jgi:kynureninase
VAACIATGVTAQITAHFSDHFSAQLTARFPSCLAAWFETPECVTPLVAPLKGAALAARVAVPFLAAPLAAAIPRPGPGPLG